MEQKSAIYQLFERQWRRGPNHCTEEHLNLAMSKGLLTQEEVDEIKTTPR